MYTSNKMSGIHLQQQQQQNEKEVKGNKAASSSSSTAAAAGDEGVVIIKCPRCDSPNTKFCYYNNYSLSQPRHFCKTCRRYWTKGGALRNVPVGGGCRKSKKLKSSTSYSSSASATSAAAAAYASSSSSDLSGFKFFSPPPTSTMDFNLKGLSLMSPPGPSTYNHHNHHPFGMDLSVSSLEPPYGMGGGSMNVNTSLASSIESLSCMNQDLHWKLQQQRLGLLKEDGTGGGVVVEAEKAPLQPILFRELNTTSRLQQHYPQQARAGGGGGDHESSSAAATEWFFGNSSYVQQVTSVAGDHHQAAASTPPSNNNNTTVTNANQIQLQQHDHHDQTETNWNVSGQQVHAWGDLHPYNH